MFHKQMLVESSVVMTDDDRGKSMHWLVQLIVARI